VKGGGIDLIAVVSARMKGWQTRTFTEKLYVHHRQMGTAKHGALMARFRIGAKDYAIGGHPLWELFRTAYQMTKRPLILGGFMVLVGYVWSMIRRVKRPVSREFVRFVRREQMLRLRNFVALHQPFSGRPFAKRPRAAGRQNR